MNTLSKEALRHWLHLKCIPQLGISTLNKINQHYSIEQFLALPHSALAQLKLKPPQINAITHPNWPLIERMEQWHELPGQHILCYHDTRYPDALKHIASPPMLLFVKGDLSVLNAPQLAIVGSRNLTITGQDNAFNFAKQLAQLGIIVTSGLAIGVDGFSHRGALDGGGQTIAVLGTGLENVYPKRHKVLAQQIIDNGALVSEFLPDQSARPENFPRRNRLISGLSQGTLVIEAAIKSGSLITAKYAMEQGREVFAIPGSIHNPMSQGCHQLIKQGAKLVENINDIIEELTAFAHFLAKKSLAQTRQTNKVDDSQNPLLAHIGFEATSVDVIAQRSLLPVNDILAQLLDMELVGDIVAVAGGYLRK